MCALVSAQAKGLVFVDLETIVMKANLYERGGILGTWLVARRQGRSVCAVVLSLSLGSCVASKMPLIVGAQPIVGPRSTAQLFRKFSDGKAHEMRMTSFAWQDGSYVNTGSGATDIARFTAEPLQADDSLIQSADAGGKLFRYWIGRKITPGAYLIFPLDESTIDDATRATFCAEKQPAGLCIVATKTQLVALAKATASKPVKNGEIAVIVEDGLTGAPDKPAIQ